MGYSFRLTARVLLYAPSHRQDSTYHGICYTSHGALAGTRNSSMDPPHEGSIRRPIAPRANALPLIYISLRCMNSYMPTHCERVVCVTVPINSTQSATITDPGAGCTGSINRPHSYQYTCRLRSLCFSNFLLVLVPESVVDGTSHPLCYARLPDR